MTFIDFSRYKRKKISEIKNLKILFEPDSEERLINVEKFINDIFAFMPNDENDDFFIETDKIINVFNIINVKQLKYLVNFFLNKI